jgi:hypothetical protein
MDFKSHLGRRFDFRIRSNLLLGIIVVASGGVALVLWLSGSSGSVGLAPIFAFLLWALLREIDPDHHWPAIIGAVLGGGWALAGFPLPSVLAVGGLVVMTRVMTSTTGRLLLSTDLAAAAVYAVVIGFTVEGWAAGFGIALAIYLDDRFRGENRLPAIATAAVAAVGTTVVASAAGAFPDTIPEVTQYVAVAGGLASLALLLREPALPTSRVDARHAAFIDQARLHASRAALGVLVFLTTILTGPDARGLLVVIAAMWLAVLSNEAESIRRRDN